MDLIEGIQFYNKALEKYQEEKLWEQWLSDMQSVDRKEIPNFNEYKKRLLGKANTPKKQQRSKEDLDNFVDKIIEKDKKKQLRKIKEDVN